jgi:hypothetical protein
MGVLIWKILKIAYANILRPVLPYTTIDVNGVTVEDAKLLDKFFSYDLRENYEQKNIEALDAVTGNDDDILIVGGGLGVTAVHAARNTTGKVNVVEASESQSKTCRQTVKLNGVSNKVQVKHGYMGEKIRTYGSSKRAKKFSLSDFDADVVQIDIEGGECKLLQDGDLPTNKIIVESHGIYGCSTEHLKEIMRNRGFNVEDLGLER